MTSLVSIIIPVWNGAKYLSQAIESALNQKFQDYEIIVVDDCSEDESGKIIKTYRDPRIKYFRNDGRLGLGKNWNKGISLSVGKYIKFLAQDDLLESEALSAMSGMMERDESVGLVSAPTQVIDAEGHVFQVQFSNHEFSEGVYPGRNVIRESILRLNNFIGNPSTVMIRRACLESLGDFNPSFCYSLDWEMWLRILGQFSWGYLSTPLSKFRIHRESQTSRIYQQRLRLTDQLRLINTVFEHPETYGSFSKEEKAPLSQQLWQLMAKDAWKSLRERQLNPILKNSWEILKLKTQL